MLVQMPGVIPAPIRRSFGKITLNILKNVGFVQKPMRASPFTSSFLHCHNFTSFVTGGIFLMSQLASALAFCQPSGYTPAPRSSIPRS